ncbi:ATP synthase subunit s [Brachionus plicatilis]|uniref:ATP synthase subunit s n=1 Tax=Brachionus plicatilis TaxID=10195 RepID=A0A3M7QEN3_BRAPC|nr:ATP synthase subunit s [Brachionus plicatilis]
MHLTRILFKTRSVRNELIEMQKNSQKSMSISEFLLWLYKERNFSILDGLRNFRKKRYQNSIDAVNKFFESDLNKLGPDLHAATYTLKMGGKCRLHGSSKWLFLGNEKIENILPSQRIEDFYVEGIDLSKTVIKYDGISNIETCSSLKTLVFKDCPFADDWLLSRISHAFSDTLEYLDISNCQNFTDNGLLTLGYLRNLKLLKMEKLNNAKNKEYISILLEENLENVVIEGANHLSSDALKSIEQKLIVEEMELRKIIESNK